MFDNNILNHAGDLQRVGAWFNSADGHVKAILGDVLHRATACRIGLRRMEGLDAHIAEQAQRWVPQAPVQDDRVVFWSPAVVTLLGEMSPLLSNLKMLQNAALPLAHKAHGKGPAPPGSLNDAMKAIGRYGIAAGLVPVIENYWVRWGKRIRGLRDLDQHIVPLSRKVTLQVRPTVQVHIPLPENPDSRNPAKLSYGDFDGLRFCREATDACFGLLEAVAQSAGYEPAPLDLYLDLKAMGEGVPGTERLLAAVEQGKDMMLIVHRADGRVEIHRRDLSAPEAGEPT